MSDIDSYDYAAHGWDRGGSMNPKCIADTIEKIKKLAAEPDVYQATTDGGWPRCGWGDVLGVEVRGDENGCDPRVQPRFLLRSWAGASWEPWYMLSDIRRKATTCTRSWTR